LFFIGRYGTSDIAAVVCGMQTPLLTLPIQDSLRVARRAGLASLHCSLDLQRSTTEVELQPDHWRWQQAQFAYPEHLKDRSVYFWNGNSFQPVSSYGAALIKLVPTEWGPPTFEIDGIKMLPTAKLSPYADAERKVALIQPRGKVILDCCGGLGYFAAWCVQGGAKKVLSFEKSPEVLWLRSLNPWSPNSDAVLSLTQADIIHAVAQMPNESVDAVLHDPPRFGIAGELYSQSFYDQLSRVLRRRGRLFHYTGSPQRVSKGRDLAGEVSHRLREAGFEAKREGDGILATKQRQM
jgi:predicted methyltransferase